MSCDIFKKVNNFKCSKNAINFYDSTLKEELFKDKDDYINTPYNEKYKINYILDDNNNYPYKLCNTVNNNNFYNCSLKYKNPWLTLSSDKSKCSLPDDIELPPNFSRDNSNNNLIFNNNNDTEWSIKKSVYQERWYDWFLIPNYHIGNNYYQHYTIDSNNKKVYGNYKPCDNNFIPYSSDNNTDGSKIFNKCVSKEYAYNGLFKNEMDFSPLALIVLLGGNIYDYNLLYTQDLYKKLNKIDFNKYDLINDKYDIIKNNPSNNYHSIEILKDINNKFLYKNKTDYDLSGDITELKNITDTIPPITTDDTSVKTFQKEPNNINMLNYYNTFNYSYSNIIHNDYNNPYEKFNKKNITNDYLTKNMFKNDYLTHKSSKLKPPDINLINIMDQYDCFNINILKICYNIAKRYKTNYELIKDNNTFEYIKTNKLINIIQASSGAPDTNYIGIDIIDIINPSSNHNEIEKNKNFIIEQFLFTYFIRYYETISDDTKKITTYNSYYNIKDNNETTNRLNDYIKKSFVLGNVFKKVVNICFDNKSDFSNYIFTVLKTADDNNLYKEPIIFDDKSFVNIEGIGNDNNDNTSNDNNKLNIYYIIFVIFTIIIIIIYGFFVSSITFFISILVLCTGIACVYYITKFFKDDNKNKEKRPFQNIKLPSLLTFIYIFIFVFVIIMIISILYMTGCFFSERLIGLLNYFISSWYTVKSDRNLNDNNKINNIAKENIKILNKNMSKVDKVIDKKKS